MWEGDRSRANSAAPFAARRPEEVVTAPSTLRVAGGHAVVRARPVRADAVALSLGMSAERAFATVLANYAAAIAENLRCVLTESDPEGSHQLRVTLRRLRTCLRVFKPVIRREPAKRVAWVARYVGAIVGELRDADVIIEDMLRPVAGPALIIAVEAWREEARARVRASLRAARATAFADDLLLMSANCGWRAKARRGARQTYSAAVVINSALEAFQTRAVERGSQIFALTSSQRHELRKDLKALRYTAELSAGYDADVAAMADALKRLQTILGQLNDMHMFTTFDPGIEAVAVIRGRIVEEHAQLTPVLIANANARWLEFAASTRSKTAAVSV